MTLQELSQLYWLNREIREDERRLSELRAEASGVPSPAGDGMPRSSEVHSRVERLALDIITLEQIIAEKYARCVAERVRLERFISSITDSVTRQVFTERFVEGRTWAGVARRIGGGNTEDSVKKICYRFLKGN